MPFAACIQNILLMELWIKVDILLIWFYFNIIHTSISFSLLCIVIFSLFRSFFSSSSLFSSSIYINIWKCRYIELNIQMEWISWRNKSSHIFIYIIIVVTMIHNKTYIFIYKMYGTSFILQTYVFIVMRHWQRSKTCRIFNK